MGGERRGRADRGGGVRVRPQPGGGGLARPRQPARGLGLPPAPHVAGRAVDAGRPAFRPRVALACGWIPAAARPRADLLLHLARRRPLRAGRVGGGLQAPGGPPAPLVARGSRGRRGAARVRHLRVLQSAAARLRPLVDPRRRGRRGRGVRICDLLVARPHRVADPRRAGMDGVWRPDLLGHDAVHGLPQRVPRHGCGVADDPRVRFGRARGASDTADVRAAPRCARDPDLVWPALPTLRFPLRPLPALQQVPYPGDGAAPAPARGRPRYGVGGERSPGVPPRQGQARSGRSRDHRRGRRAGRNGAPRALRAGCHGGRLHVVCFRAPRAVPARAGAARVSRLRLGPGARLGAGSARARDALALPPRQPPRRGSECRAPRAAADRAVAGERARDEARDWRGGCAQHRSRARRRRGVPRARGECGSWAGLRGCSPAPIPAGARR